MELIVISKIVMERLGISIEEVQTEFKRYSREGRDPFEGVDIRPESDDGPSE